MEGAQERSQLMVINFINIIENPQPQWTLYDLAENASLDWFRRSIHGRNNILGFIQEHHPRLHHQIEGVKRIPGISHRFIKRSENLTPKQNNVALEEHGQGDFTGRCTPENLIRPNLNELIKAPRRKQCNIMKESQSWEFIEIKGKLKGEPSFTRIVFGITDQIHLIVYERLNKCKKRLFPTTITVEEVN